MTDAAAREFSEDDEVFSLDAAADAAVEACDGDAWAAVRALLVANATLEQEVARLSSRVSSGYTRGRARRAAAG